jgi:hypothetical protein
MARKSSSMFNLLLYGVGGYLVYENWPAISAWFGTLVAPAASASVTIAPASAGTVVSTGTPGPAPSLLPAPVPATQPPIVPTGTPIPAAPQVQAPIIKLMPIAVESNSPTHVAARAVPISMARINWPRKIVAF